MRGGGKTREKERERMNGVDERVMGEERSEKVATRVSE